MMILYQTVAYVRSVQFNLTLAMYQKSGWCCQFLVTLSHQGHYGKRSLPYDEFWPNDHIPYFKFNLINSCNNAPKNLFYFRQFHKKVFRASSVSCHVEPPPRALWPLNRWKSRWLRCLFRPDGELRTSFHQMVPVEENSRKCSLAFCRVLEIS